MTADIGLAPRERPLEAPAGAPPIIGVGASAGGIDALQRLFRLVPPDCGMAFVVVQHLDPEHKSLLPEVLGHASRLPVRSIEPDMPVEANTVYVIPPNAALAIEQGRLQLGAPTAARGFRTPIDDFLTSLATDQGANAACVILSGSGSDGTQGLRAIKEHGGLTLAQAGAEHAGMMRSAVATGMVDEVLAVEEIPGRLADYFRHPRRVGSTQDAEAARQETVDHLAQICTLLRARTGHDFRDYKDRTVVRRVQRRMQVLQIDAVAAYVERLQQDPKELDLLFQDLLIGVTNFFRDPAAFEALARTVIPRLFENKGADDTVRVWVPGCATGEEAYSIAILLREYAQKANVAAKLQVFASDIDAQALAIARAGRYPASIANDVTPARLERDFVREDGTYRVVSDLREICLFSMHDLLRDAPFSRLDLLSCRNLLIYLNPELQDRVIPLFHYALRDDGYLFLGTSENVTRHPRLFSVVDKLNHIYRRRAVAERRLPEFPLTAPEARQKPGAPVPLAAATEGTLQALAERQLLERYAPPYVVVNGEGELLHASARTGRFLELPAGKPDSSIFSLARRGLRLELRAALLRSVSTGQVAMQSNLLVGTNGGQQAVDLLVQPLRQGAAADGLFLVVFKELGGIQPTPEDAQAALDEDVESANLRQIEQELHQTRERLQTTTEELESSNEELKSSNEELSSMNEELQSSNEELETSREELQSINEELYTVNAELNARVEELGHANSDMANLLESTQIATLFLDRDLNVKSFTPATKDVFRLVESDTGRPISHVRARFTPDLLQQDAGRVLRTLATIERQVRASESDTLYVMRTLPYRTTDNVIGGVVVTFTDISRITAAETRIGELTRDLRERIENLETLFDLVPVGIFLLEGENAEGVRLNRRGADLIGEPQRQTGFGAPPAPLRLRLRRDGVDLRAEQDPLQRAAHSGAPVPAFEARLLRADGSAVAVMVSATPLFREDGSTRGAIAAVIDISGKAAEAQQQLLLHELQHRVKNVLATIGALAKRTLKASRSPEEFTAGFLARVDAMGRMHDLLAQRDWKGTDLRELILASLAPYGGSERRAARLDGPAILLRPGPSSAMGMILHELATNAAKYGALTAPEGEVSVSWRAEGAPADERLVLTWRESGGPPAILPAQEGFGIGFVRRCVQYELDGTTAFAFRPEGFCAEIAFPLKRDAPDEPSKATGK